MHSLSLAELERLEAYHKGFLDPPQVKKPLCQLTEAARLRQQSLLLVVAASVLLKSVKEVDVEERLNRVSFSLQLVSYCVTYVRVVVLVDVLDVEALRLQVESVEVVDHFCCFIDEAFLAEDVKA